MIVHHHILSFRPITICALTVVINVCVMQCLCLHSDGQFFQIHATHRNTHDVVSENKENLDMVVGKWRGWAVIQKYMVERQAYDQEPMWDNLERNTLQ